MRQEIPEEKVGAHRFPRIALAAAALLAPGLAHASLLSGEALDTAANVVSWVVIIVVPLVVIGLFFYVHVLPELIAERNHHPQKHAIKTLCILSLFFGGLLWPLAWLWAYTKPIGYRAAYGTDKHDEFFVTMGERAQAGELTADELAHVAEEIDAIGAQRPLGPDLRIARARIETAMAHGSAPAPAAKQASAGAE